MAHVLILYNQPILAADHPEAESEAEVLFTVDHVAAALHSMGHQISRIGIGNDPANVVQQVRTIGADVVFNLFEGLPEQGETETCIAALLEWLGMSFTGSPARALSLARDKATAKLVLCGAGLPTPDFITLTAPDDPRLGQGPEAPRSILKCQPLRWPLFVKLTDQDASVGIDQGSVVTNAAALQHRVHLLFERFGTPVLVEEYIAGRELTVGIIESVERNAPSLPRSTRKALPVSEFEFGSVPDGWPIVTYDAKWRTHSTDYVHTPYREVADVSPELATQLSDLALRCFDVLGLRDYGRIDFRVTNAGEPYILEANPNPDLSPSAGIAGVLEAVGLNYPVFLNGLVEQALFRKG